MLFGPLDQFNILQIFFYKISITNFLIINLLNLLCIIIISFFNSMFLKKYFYFYIIPNCWQKFQEYTVTIIVSQLLFSSLKEYNNNYFIVISVLFNFILFSNIIGLLPYSFTPTSHMFITFYFALSVFFGINIISLKKYKAKILLLFFPAHTSIYLAFLLVPIEFISYLAKPVSLGMRLFINLMAGHTLLKVLVSFCWDLLVVEKYISILLIFPMLTLIVLFVLELAVAIIQTYVFIILTCIYIKDGN